MVKDALAGSRLIGMLQPRTDSNADDPEIERTGCAGRITTFSETEDGRFLILLTGVCRFHVSEELPLCNGYRRIVPDWSPYVGDLEERSDVVGSDALMRAVRLYLSTRNLNLDEESIQSVSPTQLVNGLVTTLPLEPVEKQALLEARSLQARAELLRAYCEFNSLKGTSQSVRH